MRRRNSQSNFIEATILVSAALFTGLLGCEHREKIVDVDTPIGDFEVTEGGEGESVRVDIDSHDSGD